MHIHCRMPPILCFSKITPKVCIFKGTVIYTIKFPLNLLNSCVFPIESIQNINRFMYFSIFSIFDIFQYINGKYRKTLNIENYINRLIYQIESIRKKHHLSKFKENFIVQMTVPLKMHTFGVISENSHKGGILHIMRMENIKHTKY